MTASDDLLNGEVLSLVKKSIKFFEALNQTILSSEQRNYYNILKANLSAIVMKHSEQEDAKE